MSKISIRDVSLEYVHNGTKSKALENIHLEVEAGEFVCVVGHSGCGKTTLLNLVAGLLFPDSGEIRIDGKPVIGPGLDRSIVFQHYSLFPWLTAKQNVAFGIKQAYPDLQRKEVSRMAEEFLGQVELRAVGDKYPFQLSGGMQQRVAIARTFAIDSGIMLLDEPFGALDPRIRHNLQETLENLWRGDRGRKTILFVTHDIEEAIVLADRIVFMAPGSISAEIQVDFPRPRRHRDLVQTPECCSMRKQLIEMFYLSDGGSPSEGNE